MSELDIAEVRRRNVEHLVNAAGGPTTFAEKVKRAPAQVSHWLGGKKIGDKLARHIEEAHGKLRGWIDRPQWPGAPFVSETVAAYEVRAIDSESEVDPSSEALVDVVDVFVSGGPGAWVPEFVETKFRMPYQLSWFRRMGAKPENVKVMPVKGSSMEPVLWDGDKIAVDLGNKRIEDDHVYALIVGGQARVKRLFVTNDERLRISSDNPNKEKYPDEYIDPDEFSRVHIIGRAIDKSGRGGL